ncbi:rRNA pseudouridine synthase [Candidatus Saccharibacteria bacterium]|nr:rRNA pseudouridine synthase [Candidatus Saccharibacteria bacterium]
MQSDESVRLNKLLAEELGVSRREADGLIERGHVTLNGAQAVLGSRVKRGKDTVAVDGTPVRTLLHTFTYILFHKPTGYVCSRRQQGEVPTIYSLLPKAYKSFKPVGRLDKDSSGLLLLTDDGDFAHRMTHPSFAKVKRYEVRLNTPLAPLHQQMLNEHGILLPDGPSKFQVSRLDEGGYEVIMKEGRNRQIRRTFAALGYEVTGLHRTHFGPYSLAGLQMGQSANTTLLS